MTRLMTSCFPSIKTINHLQMYVVRFFHKEQEAGISAALLPPLSEVWV